jgi:hypothetical protein
VTPPSILERKAPSVNPSLESLRFSGQLAEASFNRHFSSGSHGTAIVPWALRVLESKNPWQIHTANLPWLPTISTPLLFSSVTRRELIRDNNNPGLTIFLDGR